MRSPPDSIPGARWSACGASAATGNEKNAIIDNLDFAHMHETDREQISDWVWPY